jgi:hypothetical protein
MYKKPLTIILSFMMLFFSACANENYGNGKPAPELTFSQYYPLSLNVFEVVVDDVFKSKIYKNNVSKTFILPLDVALKRYIHQRLSPAGLKDRLIIKIEHSYIMHDEIFQKGKFWKWSKIGAKDRYEAYMKLKVFYDDRSNTAIPHSVVEVRRYITIPQRYNLTERELAQTEFLELFIKDADKAIMKGLRDTLKII